MSQAKMVFQENYWISNNWERTKNQERCLEKLEKANHKEKDVEAVGY